jgi:hypothetical protein
MEAVVIRIPKDTQRENLSKLSNDELKHFKMLETQFRQREALQNRTRNDEWGFRLQVIQAIRNAPMAAEKTPYVQWLCDMWDKELEIDRKAIEAENQVIADREMKKICKKREST